MLEPSLTRPPTPHDTGMNHLRFVYQEMFRRLVRRSKRVARRYVTPVYIPRVQPVYGPSVRADLTRPVLPRTALRGDEA